MQKFDNFDYGSVKQSTDILLKALSSAEDHWSHVIFRHGTVICLDCKSPSFAGFSPQTDEKLFQDNEQNWKNMQSLPYFDLIKKAYYILMDDGYPDSEPRCVPVEKKCMMTIFLNRKWSENIFALHTFPDNSSHSEMTARILGIRNRKLDYIKPQVYAVIADKLHVF